MNKVNQLKLVQAFPRLFRIADNTPYQAFGVECGDGWFNLLNKLCEDIEAVLIANGTNDEDWPRVLQVKQKFGSLRFYISHSNKNSVSSPTPGLIEMRPVADVDAIGDLIEAAEARSLEICEDCGVPGTLHKDGWHHVKCNECEKIYLKKRAEFLRG